MIEGGITTVMGLLGTDGITRDVKYIIGIKSVMHLIRTQDLVEDLPELITGNIKTLQKVRYKTGEITFSRECLEDIHSTISTYAPRIKRNQCQALPDSTKYYICEFADTKCNVILYPHSTNVSCMDKKKQNIPTEQRVRLNNKVIQFAKEGKCRDMYPTPQAESSK